MPESPIFTRACTKLEETTNLSAIEARGTVRLALKAAGLEAGSVTSEQMTVVLERVLPNELLLRGVNDPAVICASIREALDRVTMSANPTETPDAVFARLGSSPREQV
jgi:hypothetical protein